MIKYLMGTKSEIDLLHSKPINNLGSQCYHKQVQKAMQSNNKIT
jgi:hypothetical protein